MHRFVDALPAEEAAVFRGGARRVQKSTHPLFETVTEAGTQGYTAEFFAAERLSKLHIATVYSGDGALPIGIAQCLISSLVDGLAELHEAGHVCGAFTADNLVVALDGTLRLYGAPFLTLDAHRRGEQVTPITDLKAVEGVVRELLPANGAGGQEGWEALEGFADRLRDGEFVDATDAVAAVRETGWEPSKRSGVASWLKASFPQRCTQWDSLNESDSPAAAVAALFKAVPVISKAPQNLLSKWFVLHPPTARRQWVELECPKMARHRGCGGLKTRGRISG